MEKNPFSCHICLLTQQYEAVEQVVLHGVPPGSEDLLGLGPAQDLLLQVGLQRRHVVTVVPVRAGTGVGGAVEPDGLE